MVGVGCKGASRTETDRDSNMRCELMLLLKADTFVKRFRTKAVDETRR